MVEPSVPTPPGPRLRAGIVLAVDEDRCRVMTGAGVSVARYAPQLPSPRRERVSPGHLVALAEAPDGADVVVWRWYDAVVVERAVGAVRLWEPAHGEVVAQPRDETFVHALGTRAYASAGLPGAEWWVAGAAAHDPAGADVELDEVARLYADNGMWDSALRAS